MNIHKTFSKKDIVEICDILTIEIEDICDMNKAQLIKLAQPIAKNQYGQYLIKCAEEGN